MKITMIAAPAALMMALLAPGMASASLVLDTGTPADSSGLPYTLNQTNFYAAEFNLGAGQTITGVQAYVTAGMDQPDATVTIALYEAEGFTGNFPTQVFATQATYTADGWNGLSNLNWTPGDAGQYWIAVEVGGGDSAIGLSLPAPGTGGTAAAKAFASNQGNGYALGGPQIGLQVSAVPLPASAWLLMSGLLGIGAWRRQRVSA
jgi:hypothetical protein